MRPKLNPNLSADSPQSIRQFCTIFTDIFENGNQSSSITTKYMLILQLRATIEEQLVECKRSLTSQREMISQHIHMCNRRSPD